MLTDDLAAPGDLTADELRRRYATELADAVRSVGRDRVLDETGLDATSLESIAAEDGAGAGAEAEAETEADPDLRDAAAILALRDGRDPDAIVAEVRDHLLLALSSAMLDVEAVAAGIDADLDPKEIQAKIEGRLPMTLGEYAALHRFVASRT